MPNENTPTETNTETTTETKPKKKGPSKLAVIDLEGSGFRLQDANRVGDSYASYARTPHRPGIDHDCILEVGVVILDAATLQEEVRQSWLVLPPGVDTVEKFEAWREALKVADPYVYEMHSKSVPGVPSLLDDLAFGLVKNTVENIDRIMFDVVQFLREHSTLGKKVVAVNRQNGEVVDIDAIEMGKAYDSKTMADPTFDWSKAHPGNSDVMMCGNSIANYDIPMLRRWMPSLVDTLSYRIMDVSVLRTFYTELACVPLPPDLDALIRTGTGSKEATHRAMDDCLSCAEGLRGLADHAAMESNLAAMWNEQVADAQATPARREPLSLPYTTLARLAHLEMLVRYGSKLAIAEEREYLAKRDGPAEGSAAQDPYTHSYGPTTPDVAGEGMFRHQGGILRAKPEDVADDFSGGQPLVFGEDGNWSTNGSNGNGR